MLQIKEREPFSSIVLEVLDDPTKKENIFYFLCYSQLVRREGSFNIDLERFLSCAYRNFKNARNYWKDVLVEMNLFVISDLYGNTYWGKDIYKVEEGGIYLISLRHDYLPIFDSISYKALKLWNILSRTVIYRKHLTAQDAVIISTMMFNEGLYEELKSYCEVCFERYASEFLYFRILYKLSSIYTGDVKKSIDELSAVLKDVQKIEPVYYGVNTLKLKRDIQYLLEKAERGKSIGPIKIEFVNQKNKKRNWFRNLLTRIVGMFKKILKGESPKRGYSFEGGLCSRNFQTPYISL
ncbi:MAG: hypothetical protein RMI50_04740 [Aquificaceae bacterium]|nr:hypothetical protein [Aquificaceae bacterium]